MARPADRADGRARMVELRAVEPGFPYYGRMKLADERAVSATRCCEDFGVLVRPELLAQLDVDGRRRADDRIAALHDSRRHRVASRAAGSAPSASARACSSTSPTSRRPACSASAAAPRCSGCSRCRTRAFDKLIVDLRADFANEFARVRSYKATEDDIGEDFARAENYLSLVGLVIVILGGIGVSSVTRVFVQQKMKSIAVLKCVGARSSQLLAIYVAQVAVLGPGRQRCSAWCSRRWRCARFRRCWPARRPASRSATR